MTTLCHLEAPKSGKLWDVRLSRNWTHRLLLLLITGIILHVYLILTTENLPGSSKPWNVTDHEKLLPSIKHKMTTKKEKCKSGYQFVLKSLSGTILMLVLNDHFLGKLARFLIVRCEWCRLFPETQRCH